MESQHALRLQRMRKNAEDLWPIVTKLKVDAAHPKLMALLAAEVRKIGNADPHLHGQVAA